MPECKKCGSKVEEDMSFCPKCGAPLKVEAISTGQPPTAQRPKDEKEEKHEKHEKHEKEKAEKHEKKEYAFLGPLIGGIVLIIIGLSSYLEVTGALDVQTRRMMWALFIIIIGVLIIFGAFYYTMTARKKYPKP
ncbi:MAG: zinc ribbon domain-containing protein [Candidatus Bathyarchaeota archaeon]|jgi:cation transport ATPase|nr:zinc ribbon domain-containing protein [Candidatus Bathyarchaeota archaeon A05DMB-5]MDH7558468.1 zinc ribbon domain-containing protein [Candidatus Bathyarchaeota archaeon]